MDMPTMDSYTVPTLLSSKMGHDANIQYVYRPATGSRSQGTSTSWLQSYWKSVSDKYMTNMTSIWPIW